MAEDALEQYFRGVMSGTQRGIAATLLRAATRAIESFYAGIMRGRNCAYDRAWLAGHDLGRPAISVGNITAGGTGKTPVVRWLAERLRADGRRPAILLRGYKSSSAGASDEQLMLQRQLGKSDAGPVFVYANPSRQESAARAIGEHPEIDIFLLDDAFQHRKVRRDFDLVLINAAEPFGFGHVHPRGLLREPLAGLGRADAVLLTHADQATTEQFDKIGAVVRKYNADVPICRARHVETGLSAAEDEKPQRSMEELARVRFFAFAGVGHPEGLQRRFAKFQPMYAGGRWFGDHHAYSADDLAALRRQAAAAGAEVLVTTEKDWVKLEGIPGVDQGCPIWRVQLEIEFWPGEEDRLFDLICQRIAQQKAPRAPRSALGTS
ncbi:MAG TPA: tetraacyldisaccharide 4'-kinase [Tepidisphaeraceae bacterium]|jgi:tetraacyldisaccharide 4'-kinase